MPISSEDMDILHMAYNGTSKPKSVIVKFISRKINRDNSAEKELDLKT